LQVELLRLRHLAHSSAALVSHFTVESADNGSVPGYIFYAGMKFAINTNIDSQSSL
jgi:hypothetical protein